MSLSDKSAVIEDAVAQIADGATVMVGGFGVPGTPFSLIAELVRQGQKNLTIIKNDANEMGMGIDHLLANGQVSRLITTHIGLNGRAIEMMNEGVLAVEFCAQGILAERVRAGGAGLIGILTDIGEGTELAEGKSVVTVDGKSCLIEPALRADVALLHANSADPFGNLCFAATARNFNPLMAMAASCVIAETETLLPLGGVGADQVHVPGPFVDHVVPLAQLSEEYAVVRR
ncbi:CoA transferase subunit A [Cohaesibacter celericrescens]|uniref:CoA transferase subunit A n=1 Tax=Cohaesibacter celericrescens TaxID=2067669 RepID=A0A2N5XST6_9HYPH|nr:CoA transferase subunit A [Cohaesibacter celericrescens]PLW77515.1 CoA transferase subunit A [Cohaesibacter celericrescens]